MTAGALTAWSTALFLASAMFAHDVALRLLLLFGGAACAAAFVARNWRSVSVLPPIWLPFIAWAAWATLSLAWSAEPARTLKELHNEVGYTALALVLCYVGAQARDSARIILPVLAASATLLCGVAFHHYLFSPDPFGEGWHGGPGHLSSTLLMLLPGVIAVVWYGRRHAWRPVYLWLASAVGILILVAAYTTLNRTIWIGFTVQLALMLALLSLRGHGSLPWSPRKVGIVISVILVAGIAMAAYVHAEREREGAAPGPLEKDPRIALWEETLDYIAERPLTGYGFGRGLLRNTLREETGNAMLWHSHNLFLDAVLQTGAPGLALFLLLLGATLREGWRFARNRSDATAAAGIALVAIVCGMVIRNMTDLLFLRHNALFYWGAAGLLLGWGRVYRAPASS
jgi:O-antigen ligase